MIVDGISFLGVDNEFDIDLEDLFGVVVVVGVVVVEAFPMLLIVDGGGNDAARLVTATLDFPLHSGLTIVGFKSIPQFSSRNRVKLKKNRK
jgi:hypothetical protein